MDLDIQDAIELLSHNRNGANGDGNGSSKPHSTAAELTKLANKAEEIVADDSIESLQRIIHLRAYGEKLLIRVTDTELRQALWTARRKLAGVIEPHKGGGKLSFKQAPWLWEGVVMEGTTNLVVALPKVGKSRLFSRLLGHIAHGHQSFLQQAITPTAAQFLVVGTDQPESDWATCFKLAGLIDGSDVINERVIALYDKSRPLHLDSNGIETIASHAKANPGLIILLDSYYACVQALGLFERDANYAGPLLDLQEAVAPYDATLIVIHHSKKTDGAEGASAASRGTTALPSAVSQIISLSRMPKPSPLAPADRRIKLVTEGRGGMPVDLLIEQNDEGWICHGDAETIAKKQAIQEVIDGLNERQTAAFEDLVAHWLATHQGMDAQAIADALGIEGANPTARARDLLMALKKVHLAEEAGERPAAGGSGGKPTKLYRPTAAALSIGLEASAPSIPSIASLPPPTNAIDALTDSSPSCARENPLFETPSW